MASEEAAIETPLAAEGTKHGTGEAAALSTAATLAGDVAAVHPALRAEAAEAAIDTALFHLTPEEQSHPLVKALPPETDSFTYLTIVEYNLSPSSIDLLNKILQAQPDLAANIGWDLVQILLPLLPYSKPCLDTVARLGNPREVVIKVNEALEILGLDCAKGEDGDGTKEDDSVDFDCNDDDDASGAPSASGVLQSRDRRRSTNSPSVQVTVAESGPGEGGGDAIQASENLPATLGSKAAARGTEACVKAPDSEADGDAATEARPEERFKQMLSMIRVLHPRIKTKRPSKFLVTTVEAILCAFSGLGGCVVFGESTDAVLDLLEDLSSLSKPPLPPRAGSQTSVDRKEIGSGCADDPEAEPVEVNEGILQGKILISFATRLFEVLVTAAQRYLPPQTISWTARYMEEHFPGRLPQGIMKTDPQLQSIVEKVRQYRSRVLSILPSRLGLGHQRLRSLLPTPSVSYGNFSTFSSDLPLSETGVLYLLADSEFERIASGQKQAPGGPLDHREVVETYLGRPDSLELSPELLAVIDAILILGWAWTTDDNDFHHADEGRNEAQERYNRYLQHLSLISANAPYPVLRYQVHLFVTRVLHSTRDVEFRVSYIRDTLFFCPFQNLKVTAVGWLKDEIAAAFGETGMTYPARGADGDPFTQPGTLRIVADALFEQPPPPPTAAANEPDADEEDDEHKCIQQKLPFWLAVLNLLYLLCVKTDISVQLRVDDLARERELLDTFVEPLDRIARHLLQDSDTDGGFNGGTLLADAASKARDVLRRVAVV